MRGRLLKEHADVQQRVYCDVVGSAKKEHRFPACQAGGPAVAKTWAQGILHNADIPHRIHCSTPQYFRYRDLEYPYCKLFMTQTSRFVTVRHGPKREVSKYREGVLK